MLIKKKEIADTQASKSILTNREIHGRERLTFHAKDVTRQKAADGKIALAGWLVFLINKKESPCPAVFFMIFYKKYTYLYTVFLYRVHAGS